MKIYIVKEDYTCNAEDASGWNCDERHDRIVGVSLTLDEAREMVKLAIADNCEEYYTVDESDYQIIEAEPGYERWRYVLPESRWTRRLTFKQTPAAPESCPKMKSAVH